MKITWLGHSSFKLEESTGTVVVTDPYSEKLAFDLRFFGSPIKRKSKDL